MDRILFYPIFVTVRERQGFPRAFLVAWFDCAKWVLDAQMVFWTGVCPGSFEKSTKLDITKAVRSSSRANST
jgi:hypothetical protein